MTRNIAYWVILCNDCYGWFAAWGQVLTYASDRYLVTNLGSIIWVAVRSRERFRVQGCLHCCVFIYTVQNNSFGEMALETNEWIARCSARLHAQWPRLQREQRDEVARDLWHDQRWQQSEPEVAVVEWLSQGIPVPVGAQL